MRALLLAALLGLALTPLALPAAEATSCQFLDPLTTYVVCKPIFVLLCVGNQWHQGITPKGLAGCVLP